jgi:hypothetical protein
MYKINYGIIILTFFVFILACNPTNSDSGDSGDSGDGGDSSDIWTETILSSPGNQGDQFGWSVATSEDGKAVAVGALDDSQFGEYSGAVYVYKKSIDQWNFEKITAFDADEWSKFGSHVSLSDDGNTVAIGAMWDTAYGGTGAAYVYSYFGINWSGVKIKASDGDGTDWFGKHLAISGDAQTLMVGASGDDDPDGEDVTPDSGSAYIFDKNGTNWDETKILPSNGEKNAFFGTNVDVSNDGSVFVVGSYGHSNGVEGARDGLAYVYRWNETSQEYDEYILEGSDIAYHDAWYGYSTAITGDGNTVVVGAPNEIGNSGSGSVYVYEWNGTSWMETKLIPAEGGPNMCFGSSVSISDDASLIIVGEPDTYAYAGTETPGYVHLFEYNGSTWTEEDKFTSTGAIAGSQFGDPVEISGDGSVFVVGHRIMNRICIYSKDN